MEEEREKANINLLDHGILLGVLAQRHVVIGEGGDEDHGGDIVKEGEPLLALAPLPSHVDNLERHQGRNKTTSLQDERDREKRRREGNVAPI